MPRKPKEVEQEIDINVQEKKETFATRWFKDYAVNDYKDMKTICDLTARSADEQFSMKIKSGNTETYAIVFYATFMTILQFLKEKQKKWNNFTIEVCNSINIGYTNNDNEDNEKVGNFMPILEHISINRTIVDTGSAFDKDTTAENFIRWKELNIKKNIEFYKDIQEKTFELLKTEYRIHLRSSEAVIPLFCIFMDNIPNVLKQKYKEAADADVSEVSMNVLGLFDAYYSYNDDDGIECIDYTPNIAVKLALKADDVASRE